MENKEGLDTGISFNSEDIGKNTVAKTDHDPFILSEKAQRLKDKKIAAEQKKHRQAEVKTKKLAEKQLKKQEKKERRKTRIATVRLWAKNHRFLSVIIGISSIALVLALIFAGVFTVRNIIVKNLKPEEDSYAEYRAILKSEGASEQEIEEVIADYKLQSEKNKKNVKDQFNLDIDSDPGAIIYREIENVLVGTYGSNYRGNFSCNGKIEDIDALMRRIDEVKERMPNEKIKTLFELIKAKYYIENKDTEKASNIIFKYKEEDFSEGQKYTYYAILYYYYELIKDDAKKEEMVIKLDESIEKTGVMI